MNQNETFWHKHMRLRHENKNQFHAIFGVFLSDYFDNITGFDIVKFDNEFIKAPDGQSTSDVVLERYGDEAMCLCLTLLGK